jgi:hypothetical protein
MTNRASRANGVTGRRSQPARAVLVVLALLAAAAIGLLASACGGGSSSGGVAQVETTETTTDGSGSRNSSGSADPPTYSPAAYSACMRRNGVPKFPDPDSEGRLDLRNVGLDPDSPRLEAAEKACEKFSAPALSPAERSAFQDQALKYSACIREHGVSNFPDPQPGGDFVIGRKVDSNSPRFSEAAEACENLIPGRPGTGGGEGGTP